MATKTAAKPAEPIVAPGDDEEGRVESLTSWEWIAAPPTSEQLMDRLKSLPLVWGISHADYADHVVALSQNKKVKQPGQAEVRVEVWHVYMAVAGRVAMLNAAAEKHGWTVDFLPEPTTPTGVPGWLETGERIVYREYCVIVGNPRQDPAGARVALGSKPGTAWVPARGGSGAAGSNPYEKVETSARGRSIAAWGFGVFPGSGVASLEEMQDALARQAQPQRARGEAAPREAKPREQMVAEIVENVNALQLVRGITSEEQWTKIREHVHKAWNRDLMDADGNPSWAGFKDAELALLLGQTSQLRRHAEAQAAAL